MHNMMEYKGYFGSAEYSAPDRCFHGKLEYIDDLVTFESDTVAGLEREFAAAVEDYIETCGNIGKEPEEPFGGFFDVRIPPELHRKAALIASQKGIAFDTFVETAIRHETEAFPL